MLNRTHKDVNGNACQTGRRGRLPTFHTNNEVARTLPISPVVLRLRVLTNQQHNRPHSVLDWAYQTLKPIQVTTVVRQFSYLSPAT